MMNIKSGNILYVFKHPRFPFWKILLITTAVWIIYWLMTLGFIFYTPKELQKGNFPTTKELVNKISFIQLVIGLLFNMLFFYFMLNIYYYAGILKKKVTHYIIYTVIFFACWGVYYLLYETVFPESYKAAKNINGGYGYDYFITIGIIFMIIIYALIVYIAVSFANSKDEKKRNQELLEQNSKLELEKLKAEYNFLKAQINPHFLHNSLNFLYAKALPFSSELSEGILTISEIMRYALMNDVDSGGLVLLNKEIDHIRNIIKMNQLRYQHTLNIQFDILGAISGIKILPLVLITIVENAFKHGNIRDEKFPVVITLNVDNEYIYFSCLNKKKTGPKELSFGIGLSNTQKRLQMIYQNKADMQIIDTIDTYEVKLKIPYYND